MMTKEGEGRERYNMRRKKGRREETIVQEKMRGEGERTKGGISILFSYLF